MAPVQVRHKQGSGLRLRSPNAHIVSIMNTPKFLGLTHESLRLLSIRLGMQTHLGLEC